MAVEYYPGLWRWKHEADDTKRIADLKASFQRESLAMKHADPADYLRSLQITLTYFWDQQAHLGRLADLCRKTNQFNLALRRFSEAELFDLMNRPDACVASVQLSDRLSDSGIIAVIVAERSGNQLRVEELCISCRAIGRFLENDIVINALRRMSIWRCCEIVKFHVRKGERNQPALNWLNRLLEASSVGISEAETYTLPTAMLETILPLRDVVLKNGE
jgi:FkbH-like protein